eukprot:1892865-Rhodomonas_salina.1
MRHHARSEHATLKAHPGLVCDHPRCLRFQRLFCELHIPRQTRECQRCCPSFRGDAFRSPVQQHAVGSRQRDGKRSHLKAEGSDASDGQPGCFANGVIDSGAARAPEDGDIIRGILGLSALQHPTVLRHFRKSMHHMFQPGLHGLQVGCVEYEACPTHGRCRSVAVRCQTRVIIVIPNLVPCHTRVRWCHGSAQLRSMPAPAHCTPRPTCRGRVCKVRLLPLLQQELRLTDADSAQLPDHVSGHRLLLIALLP